VRAGLPGGLDLVHGPINYISEFSSYLRVVFFMGVFVLLTKSKNYEIRRVVKGV